MSEARLQIARELIAEQEYDAARALLATLPPHPTAIRLLVELEDLAPPLVSRHQWQYADMSWRMISFVEGIAGSYSPAEAILHRFGLIVREYAELDLANLALSSIDFHIGRNLDTFVETDTATYRSRFSPAGLDFELFYQEQPEAFRTFQPVILRELNDLLEVAAKAHLVRLGAEGWELITVRARPPDVWADFHANVRAYVGELCSLYVLKRRVE
jgi:hypothetical protein